ncbi:MAG: hypothetical protein U0Q16_17050 [Bryobacteraceae bacterium]
MSSELNYLVAACFVGLISASALYVRKTGEWALFAIWMVALVAWAALLNSLFGFPFAPQVTGKGANDDLVLAAALFLCMLAGMFAHHFYRRFERPKRYRTKWDWGLFFAPIFASPIVFIPLLAAFSGSDINLKNLTAARLMIFFVAFQNGFFWKEFFDRKQKEEVEKK